MALAAKSAKLRELEVQVPELQKELATGKQVGAPRVGVVPGAHPGFGLR